MPSVCGTAKRRGKKASRKRARTRFLSLFFPFLNLAVSRRKRDLKISSRRISRFDCNHYTTSCEMCASPALPACRKRKVFTILFAPKRRNLPQGRGRGRLSTTDQHGQASLTLAHFGLRKRKRSASVLVSG